MFNKLRNNYVFTNMALVGTIVVISFLSMYLMIFNNTLKSLDYELDQVYSSYRNQTTEQYYNSDMGFVLEVDNFGVPTETNDKKFVKGVHIEEVLKTMNRSKNNRFKLNSFQYAYKTINSNTKDEVNYIVVLEVTKNMKDLSNFRSVLIFILLITLGFIFIICVYLANKSVNQLKEAWEKQRQFIGDASHELKTPLAVIETNVDALSLHHKSQWTDNIKSETKRMSKLLSDLLYLTKMDDYDLMFTHNTINFSNLISDQLLTYEVLMFEKGITLKTEIDKDVLIVQDEEKLKQVLHILIDNAIKYSEKYIEIKLKQEFNQITFSIENDGVGISKEDLNNVFDRFFKGDESRVYDDSHGLGLSIAHTIVERMKADIYVQSIEDEKTKFTILFDV